MRQGADPEPTYRLMRKVCGQSIWLYVLITGAGFFGAGYFIPIVMGPGFGPVVPVFRILCAALLVLGVGWTLAGVLLYPLRHDRDVALISSIRMISTVTLVCTAGALMGGLGGAWGRLFAATLTLGFAIVIIRRRELLPILSSGTY